MASHGPFGARWKWKMTSHLEMSVEVEAIHSDPETGEMNGELLWYVRFGLESHLRL